MSAHTPGPCIKGVSGHGGRHNMTWRKRKSGDGFYCDYCGEMDSTVDQDAAEQSADLIQEIETLRSDYNAAMREVANLMAQVAAYKRTLDTTEQQNAEQQNADLLAALRKIHANAAESVEWIRRVCDEAIEKATK